MTTATRTAAFTGATRRLMQRWRKPFRYGYFLAGGLFSLYLFAVIAPVVGGLGTDTFAYWVARPPLYEGWPEVGAYLYSPAFWQVTEPLRGLGWPVFAVAWGALNVGAAAWLGPLVLAFPLTSLEVYHGNIHLLLAVAIVVGFRYPAAWAFVLHTKASCGVGLLWFAVRREWRSLGIVLGVSAGIAAVSFIAMPDAWSDHVSFLFTVASGGSVGYGPPIAIRLAIAAVLVSWGALTDRRWTVPTAAMIALPNLWWHGLAMLGGAIALTSRHRLPVRRVPGVAVALGILGRP